MVTRSEVRMATRMVLRRAIRLGRRVAASLTLLFIATSQSSCLFNTGDIELFSFKPKPLEEHVVSGRAGDKILLLDISRVISNQSDSSSWPPGQQQSVVARVEAELQLASADPEVKAVIIRINSPGGTVTASDILYHRIMRFKKQRDVPVIALFVDMGTSGAYYAALAADEIVAHPTTVTGSIGVVMHSINLVGLMDKLGVHDQTVKTGAKKDIGSPLRDMTADERTLLESVLDDMQSRFMALVRERRTGLSEEAQREIADGRILSAGRAKDIGLVDRIGYLDDTVALAQQMAGLPESRLIMYRRPDEMSETAYSRAAAQPSVINLIQLELGPLLATPQFLYLWMPPSL